MNNPSYDERFSATKERLLTICDDSGILEDVDTESIMNDNMIENGIIDSVGVVCLQDQIDTHFNISIELDHFIGECYSLKNLIDYLVENEQETTAQ